MSADLLTRTPQKGTLKWRFGAIVLSSYGWFDKVGAVIVKRNYSKTDSWSGCWVDEVVEFIPDGGCADMSEIERSEVDVVAKGRKVAEWLKSCKIIFEPCGNGEKVEALCAEVERLQARVKELENAHSTESGRNAEGDK